MEASTKTLRNNKVTQFILRIDLMPGSSVDFKMLAEALSSDYGMIRTQLHVNYNVDMQEENVRKEEFLTYILGKSPNVTLTLSSFERSILLTSNHYADNCIYKERLARIIAVLSEQSTEISASRIGMRYINVFPSIKPADISKYLNADEASSIKSALKQENISRAMLVHEYQFGDYQARIQCGIPNKFYPAVITNYELTLDIDVYGSGAQPLKSWEESVRDYNHGAYDMFLKYVKPSLIEELK